MPLGDLSPDELKILHRCLRATADDKELFPDWEFHSLFGLDRAEFVTVLDTWPRLDESKLITRVAIQNSLNNLLGYPHQYHDDWDGYFGFGKAALVDVFEKWLGRLPTSYLDGMT